MKYPLITRESRSETPEPPPKFRSQRGDAAHFNTSSGRGSAPSPFSPQAEVSCRGPQCRPGCRGSPTHQTPKRCVLAREGPRAKPRGRLLSARTARPGPGAESLGPRARPSPEGLHPGCGCRRGSGAAGRSEAVRGGMQEQPRAGQASGVRGLREGSWGPRKV